MFKPIALVCGMLCVGVVALVFGGNASREYQPIEQDMYQEMWEPFVTIVVSDNGRPMRYGSGVLVAAHDAKGCHVYAFTNHHVVYGEEPISKHLTATSDKDESVITVQLAYKMTQSTPEIHLAEVIRTSESADASFLMVPRLSCDNTPVARLASSNNAIKIGKTKLWHVTSAGGNPATIEMIPAYVTRFGIDEYGNLTLSSSLPILLGMSGSPVFVQTWSGYEIIGIVEGYNEETGRPNYIVPVEILHILLNEE